MIFNHRLTWITSLGGPLLMLPCSHLPHWYGTDEHPENGLSDYDRACAIDDYLGLIDVGDGQALVLSGNHLQSAWIPFDGADGGTIVRWEYAESEDHLVDSLESIPANVWDADVLTFDIVDARQAIFDSAYPGTEFEDSLTMELPVGQYIVTTSNYQPDDKTSIFLHRFARIA